MSRDREALIDIVEAVKLILRYVEAVDFDDLVANIEKQDAILRRITIIGEATKRLSKDFRDQHPTIPWKEIAGMRDVITHAYDEVDLDEVWTVVNENLPQLLAYVEPLTLPEAQQDLWGLSRSGDWWGQETKPRQWRERDLDFDRSQTQLFFTPKVVHINHA